MLQRCLWGCTVKIKKGRPAFSPKPSGTEGKILVKLKSTAERRCTDQSHYSLSYQICHSSI